MSRVYFTDRNLGKQFPSILAQADIEVERHGELFRPEGSDEQWLEHCGVKDRIAITHDLRIRYVPNELEAVKRFRVRLLVLIGHAPTAELASNFVKSRGKIEGVLEGREGPLILKVYRPSPSELARSSDMPGRVEVSYPRIHGA